MKVLLAGLWARRGLNAATLLVSVVAVTAAVLGPMYGREASEHLVDTRIAARPPYTVGLTYAVQAMPTGTTPRLPGHGSRGWVPPSPTSLMDKADRMVRGPGVATYWQHPVRWLRDPGGSLKRGEFVFDTPLYWRAGMCRLAEVEGTCPTKPGDVLVQRTMAKVLGVEHGGSITLDYTEHYMKMSMSGGTGKLEEVEKPVKRTFHVVGTYTIADPGSPEWFDLSRFTGIDNLVPIPSRSGANPMAPALLTAPATMTSETFAGGVDRAIDPRTVDLATLDAADRSAQAFMDRALSNATADQTGMLDLASLVKEIHAEHALLFRVTVAALAPFVVLALLLIFALVSAAAQVRRPYVSLAKLRGHSRTQVLAFAVAEPFLVVLLAVPVGVALAVASAHVVAREWLTPGIPVRMDLTTWTSLAAVALSSLVATLLAAMAVIREPLAKALKASVGARPASRTSLVLRSAVVAVAVASVAQLLTSGDQSSQLLALLAPMFVALAVAVAGAALLRKAGSWWVGRTAAAGSAPGFLAARRLARRQDLANLMVPLLLAVSVITFAASASAVSGDWRVSRAKAAVGAPASYLASASPGRLLRLTHQVDPSGKHLAAAVVDNSGSGAERRLFVDAPRLGAVAAWDDSWSDVPLSTLARRLSAGLGKRLTFQGGRVAVSVDDVHLRSATHEPSYLWLQYLDDQGEERDVELGRLRNGAAATLSATVGGCARSCDVQQLYLTGGAQAVSDVDGRLTLTRVAVDGRTVDWGLTRGDGWRPARPFPVSLVDTPVVPDAAADGLHLKVYLGQLPAGADADPTMVAGYARITPGSSADVTPVVLTRTTRTRTADVGGAGTALSYPHGVVQGTGVSGETMPARVVARVRSLPLLGDEGEMADLETSLVEFEPPVGAVVVTELWTTAGTPASMLAKIRDAGVELTPIGTVDSRLHELRRDAFTLGLRLYLLVGLATLLLAVFGVFASAVLQSRWRSYEVASLRVVGVSQRSLVRASVLEYAAMLGLAVLLGVGASWLSLRLVLPSLSLGNADPHEPAPVFPVHWLILGGVGGALFCLALLIAVVVSRRTTRLGRPSTLRWAEQG
jgi:hypothetical protein